MEAVIALSIMYVASEILLRDPKSPRLSERYPWAVAFAFGLLHGLGFGSALLDIGLPQAEVIVALLAFNIGVELGQVLFIVSVMAGFAILRRLAPARLHPTSVIYQVAMTAMPYSIGGMAAFWFVQRLAGF